MSRKSTDYIIIHCTATRPSQNIGFEEEKDKQLIKCLPGETKDFLISSFLWDEFLNKFRRTLLVRKQSHILTSGSRKLYTWNDVEYRDFIYFLLQNLEPLRYKKREHIHEEFDDVNEIFFVERGKVVIGYDLNKTNKYCL